MPKKKIEKFAIEDGDTVAEVQEEPAEGVAVLSIEKPKPQKKKYKVKKDLDLNMFVTVKNGFSGSLVYISKRTGERFVWQEFGDEQEMELLELKNAKNTCKDFFVNNWFLIDDQEVIDYLGLSKYYKYALNSEEFDSIFEKSPEEIKDIISTMSNGQKRSLVFRAKQLISNEIIDSIKVINVLEEGLGVLLIER